MANLWDELDDEQRNELVQQHLAGSKKDNANLNRAREQLANNPNLVARLAQEAGFGEEVDPELEDTEPDGDETDNSMDGQNEIDRAVSASLGDTNVQETGSVTNQTEIPPPQEGEDINAYVERLMASQQNDAEGFDTIEDEFGGETTIVRRGSPEYEAQRRLVEEDLGYRGERAKEAAAGGASVRARWNANRNKR